jgi:hypothetical protein
MTQEGRRVPCGKVRIPHQRITPTYNMDQKEFASLGGKAHKKKHPKYFEWLRSRRGLPKKQRLSLAQWLKKKQKVAKR